MSSSQTDHNLMIILDKPIPMLGLHAQHLGFVERCALNESARTIDTVELQTNWQRIAIDRSAVAYDADSGVFRLLRGDALVHRGEG